MVKSSGYVKSMYVARGVMKSDFYQLAASCDVNMKGLNNNTDKIIA